MSTVEQFAHLIRRTRKQQGYSMHRLAELCSERSGRRFHTTTISRYERGEGVPDLEQALVILDVLRVPLSSMGAGASDPGPWIDGSRDTLDELEDLVAGRAYVDTIDPDTGQPDVVEVIDAEAGLGELPEIPDEAR